MVVKVNTTHIVPGELNDGLVINLPELMLYHFVSGAYQRRYSLGLGEAHLAHPHRDLQDRGKAHQPHLERPAVHPGGDGGKGPGRGWKRCRPAPKNPLGNYCMGTSAEGVGIHATNRPWSVGYLVSHGCIRMLPQEIAQFFPQIEVGTPVKIIYRPVKLAVTPEGRVYLEAHPDIYHLSGVGPGLPPGPGGVLPTCRPPRLG